MRLTTLVTALLALAAASVGLAQPPACPIQLQRKAPIKAVRAGRRFTTFVKVTNPGSLPVVVDVAVELPDNVCVSKTSTCHVRACRCGSFAEGAALSHTVDLRPIAPRHFPEPQEDDNDERRVLEQGRYCQPACVLAWGGSCHRQDALLQGERERVDGLHHAHHHEHLDLRLHAGRRRQRRLPLYHGRRPGTSLRRGVADPIESLSRFGGARLIVARHFFVLLDNTAVHPPLHQSFPKGFQQGCPHLRKRASATPSARHRILPHWHWPPRTLRHRSLDAGEWRLGNGR